MSFILISFLVALLVIFGARFAFRHDVVGASRFMCLGLLILVSLPLMLLLPKRQIDFSVQFEAAERVTQGFSLTLMSLWGVGLIFFALRFLHDGLALRALLKNSQSIDCPVREGQQRRIQSKLGLSTDLKLRLSPKVGGPCILQWKSPILLVPANSSKWSDETWSWVLYHELTHLKRHDLWWRAVGIAACLINWFNPLVWLLRRRSEAMCEFACDSQVLERRNDAASYAHSLCDVASAKIEPVNALGMGTTANLKNRIEALVRNQTMIPKWLFFGLVVAIIGISVGSAIVRPVTTPEVLPNIVENPDLAIEAEIRHSANPFPKDGE